MGTEDAFGMLFNEENNVYIIHKMDTKNVQPDKNGYGAGPNRVHSRPKMGTVRPLYNIYTCMLYVCIYICMILVGVSRKKIFPSAYTHPLQKRSSPAAA